MKAMMKQCIGKALINIANSWPTSKGFLKSLGMRATVRLFSPRRAVSVQTPNGQTLKLTHVSSNYLSLQLFWKGTSYYEPLTTLAVQELLHPGSTFVDVGANIGFFSLTASLTKLGIEVIAFEPNPKNYAILKENIRANGFENIHCEPLAVSDRAGTAKFYLNTSDMSASLLPNFQRAFNPASNCVEVQTTTLDDYFDKHFFRNRSVWKIDVEGHETVLLQGARRMLATHAPDLIIEVLQPYPEETSTMLKELGYEFYHINELGLVRSEKLHFERRGDFCFLNYLISKRPEAEVSHISEKIAARAKQIDFRQTSKYFGPQIKPFESVTAWMPPFVTLAAKSEELLYEWPRF